jgi:hypothetical protein
MSDSTTNLDLISSSQAQKEVTANAIFDAESPAALWGRRASTSAALTWGFYGGVFRKNDNALATVANGTVALTANVTNYVEAHPTTGAVTVNSSGFTAGSLALYSVVAGAATVTSYTDFRAAYKPPHTVTTSGGALATYGAGSNGFDTAGHANELHAMVVQIRAALIANGIMS